MRVESEASASSRLTGERGPSPCSSPVKHAGEDLSDLLDARTSLLTFRCATLDRLSPNVAKARSANFEPSLLPQTPVAAPSVFRQFRPPDC